MTKKKFPIDDSNIQAVCAHINKEFEAKSWWPGEGPWLAKEEFEQMHHSPELLEDWCDKWLDSSQWRQLKIAVNRQDSSPSAVG